MRTILQDLRVALRVFRRRPGFAFVATGTLALGIGAHAALFSVVDGVLLQPVDLPRADELVVARMEAEGELRNLTGPNAADLLRESGEVFASVAAFSGAGGTIQTPDGTREGRIGAGGTAEIFEVLGVPLQLGRPYGDEAVGTGALTDMVISDRLWRSHFGADPGVIGTTVSLSGTPIRITGVTAPGFVFPTREDADFIYAPPVDLATIQRAGLGGFTVLGRLHPGISVDRARAEIQGIWEGIREQHPGDLLDNGIAVMGLQDYIVRDVRPALLAFLGATFLLLVLACANVANLMLARGLGRGTEMSIRASLGADRGRLIRQLLVESAVLTGVAGLLGVALAEGGLAAVRALAPPEIPGIAEAELSLRATAFALCVVAGCAVVMGLVPAVRSSRRAPSSLRSGTRATAGRALRRIQGGLVVAQVAAAVVLALGAGLLIRSFANLADVDPGYRTEGVLTASVSAPGDVYTDGSSRARFYRQVERAVAGLPGVMRVGTTLRAPFSTGELSLPVRLADDETMTIESAPRVELSIVSGGYVEALGIPVLRGRTFNVRDDGESLRVALISASLARSLYGDENPIGRRLAPVVGSWDDATTWAEIVGVVGDIRLQGLDRAAAGMLYMATAQMPQPAGTLVVQTSGDPTALGGAVREALMRVEPRMTAPTIQTLASLRSENLAPARFNSFLLGVFSSLALVLAAVGIYGLLSYAVAERRLELGVRVAFGADRGRVLRLVLAQGMTLSAVGLLLGAAVAMVASRGLGDLLFGITPNDPTTYAATLTGVAAIALAGCVIPALRAASGDPVAVLRRE